MKRASTKETPPALSASPGTDGSNESAPDFRLVGVIDMGATSLRMVIAELHNNGKIQQLEALQQAVNLGRDAFTKGMIRPETTEICVQALRSFKRILDEYGIRDARNIRAVATSAVREAANRDAFLDRLYIGSGINVETIDAAEVNRYMYLSVEPQIKTSRLLRRKNTIVVEVGGGSTEVLAVENGQVVASHSFRLGALRMREMLEDFRAPAARLPGLLANQIDTSVGLMTNHIPIKGEVPMVALGGDMRFAVMQLLGRDTQQSDVVRVNLNALSELADAILSQPVDALVRKYDLSFPAAECLGPALLAYVRLAKGLKLKSIYVASATLRDGLLAEMARDSWSGDFTRQIVNSALQLAEKYQEDVRHAQHVAKLALKLFDALQDEHRLTSRHRLILHVACLLHDIGLFVSNQSHHKHSMYLIRNSELFGFGEKDTRLAALVARYHRRAGPKNSHDVYMALDREKRIAVSKLAAILRVADALDRGHSRYVRDVDIQRLPGVLAITVPNVTDLSVEELGLQQKGPMFEQVYGLRVVLRSGRVKESP